MLRSGKEHLESLRDGRVVYVGSQKIDDVTTHPAFRNAAATVAALYDMKADPKNRADLTYEEDGGRHSVYYLRARSRDDLQRRMIDFCSGVTYALGGSMDKVADQVFLLTPSNVEVSEEEKERLQARGLYRASRS